MDIEENIDEFFLNALLRISIAGILLILVSNVLLSPQDVAWSYVAGVILITNMVAYQIRRSHPHASTIVVTLVGLLMMAYQRINVPGGSISLSVVMILGFIISILLRGKLMWAMHGLAFLILNTVFVIHAEDKVTAAIAYSSLYIILSYASGTLKFKYDRIYQRLKDTNVEIKNKAEEIEHQNSELLKIQGNLNSLNMNLEKMVYERTEKIVEQNKLLVKYSYTNAHHLRGPVARLLGLGSIYKLDPVISADFVIQKMVEEAQEIDSVIKRISLELDNDVNNEKS